MNPTQRRDGVIPSPGFRLLAALTLLAGSAWWLRRARPREGTRRVVVAGPSMIPTLEPGDRLLVRRAVRLRPGDIVAVRDPRDRTRILIKRVRAVTADGIDVRGDNPSLSTDSRAFGPVAPGAVVGRAWYRYGPPGRTGRLAAPGDAWS